MFNNPAASFTPSRAAVCVNLLWFLSLVISLSCALLATLLQQWARRYLSLTNPRCSPHRRALIREFFAKGVERLYLPWTVEALPTLLHVSLFLFFAGLGVFLFSIHKTIFSVVVTWIGVCVVVYAYVTTLPILCKDSPYHAPLSSFLWFCVTGVRYAAGHENAFRDVPGTRDPEGRSRRTLFRRSLHNMTEEHANKLSPHFYYDALSWMFESLDEDIELERFFEGVPGLCKSKAVEKPVEDFIRPNDRKLSSALTGLMDRTLSSDILPESVKQKRITICIKAIGAASLYGPWWFLDRVLLGNWQAFLRSIDFGIFLKDWDRVDRPITAFYAQCTTAVIISNVQAHARDERWQQLVTRQIGVSKSILQGYLNQGDSTLLANLNYVVEQTLQISSGIEEHYEAFIKEASSKSLECLCKLDVRSCLPELQDEFCRLWNKLLDAAENDKHPYVRNLSLATLKNIRKVHMALHMALHENKVTLPTTLVTNDDNDVAPDDIASYHMCTIPGYDSTLPNGLPAPYGQAAAGVGGVTQSTVPPLVGGLPTPVSGTSTAITR